MSTHELIRHYESLVKFGDKVLSEENPRLAEYVTELRDAWENRSVLRHLRYLAGIPICNGDGHCLESPTARCMDGKHETCPAHTDSCYLCLPLN